AADADVYYCRTASATLLSIALWCRTRRRTCLFAAANDSDARFRAGSPTIPLHGWRRIPYIAGLGLASCALAQHELQRLDFQLRGLRAFVVPNAVELPALASDGAAPGPNPEAKVVLAVGRIVPQKRPERIVDLARRLPHRSFVLVGGGTPSALER